MADPNANHEHLPLGGDSALIHGARLLLFGNESVARVASIQTIAGTGANHLAAKFIADTLTPKNVWVSDPSWINHQDIWRAVDDAIQRRTYPYFNATTFSLSFDAMTHTLREETEPGDVVILHACAHNPTGLDMSQEQWSIIADICEDKKLFPLFDIA